MKDHKGQEVCTTDGRPGEAADISLRQDGQQKDYRILCTTEREKGFVRPVRQSYRHVGPKPTFPFRPLTDEEKARHPQYVAFEPYPEGYKGSATGRFWTQEKYDRFIKPCGVVTTMGLSLSETYARDPSFYGATFCCGCGTHFPVGEDGEFVWEPDGSKVGT